MQRCSYLYILFMEVLVGGSINKRTKWELAKISS